MLDLTTLEGKDTPGKVAHLCQKALHPMATRYKAPRSAAVCVYPKMVKTACQLVAGSGMAVASVATAFPSGQYPLRLRLKDVQFAIGQGATEIDMVIDRGAFLCGEYRKVASEIEAVKAACGEARLKVIFETGELETYDKVRLASEIAMHSGADFNEASPGQALSPRARLLLRRSGVSSKCCFIESAASGGELDP
jgi:deoxyribose-phosphate aldolase